MRPNYFSFPVSKAAVATGFAHTRRYALAGLCSALCAVSVMAGPVNVNTADAKTLAAELNGIGLSKARAIVAYREAHGPFERIEDLASVKGVGAKLLERNIDNVLLSDPG